MKCSRCGHDSGAPAAFCSRCGTRFVQPSSVGREHVVMTVQPSWWHFIADFLIAFDLVAGGLYLCVHGVSIIFGALFLAAGLAVGALVIFAGKRTIWTLTSERLIAHRSLFAKTDREMQLTDTRSVTVVRSLGQKLFALGSVAVASINDADFQILIEDIQNPDQVVQAIKGGRQHFA